MNILKRGMVFVTFFGCCFAIALMAAAMSTKYWLEAEAIQLRFHPTDNTTVIRPNSTGHVNFGLFKGRKNLNVGFGERIHAFSVVCSDDGDCMYSCGKTKKLREEQLQLTIEGNPKNFSTAINCEIVQLRSRNPSRAVVPLSLTNLREEEQPLLFPLLSRGFPATGGRIKSIVTIDKGIVADVIHSNDQDVENEELYDTNAKNDYEVEVLSETTTTEPVDPQEPEFMSYGLWAGTIACLVIAMVFAVVGALFAVINTATTPVEAITGVPGLYLWNGMAALFSLICVILWGVQFSLHLTSNVLLYDAPNGWTTKNMEVLGYSYWLVVVAIVVHIANIVIIYVGTYERKVKEQIERPEDKTRNIMLY